MLFLHCTGAAGDDLLIPGWQLRQGTVSHFCTGQTLQQVFQIFIDIQAMCPGHFDHSVYGCAGLSPFRGIAEQPVFMQSSTALQKPQKQTTWSHMTTLNTCSLRYRSIWRIQTVAFWTTCSPGHRTSLRPARSPVKMKWNKTGAKLPLSYRFALVLYRYSLELISMLNPL